MDPAAELRTQPRASDGHQRATSMAITAQFRVRLRSESHVRRQATVALDIGTKVWVDDVAPIPLAGCEVTPEPLALGGPYYGVLLVWPRVAL